MGGGRDHRYGRGLAGNQVPTSKTYEQRAAEPEGRGGNQRSHSKAILLDMAAGLAQAGSCGALDGTQIKYKFGGLKIFFYI